MDGSQSLVPADIRRRRFTAADVQVMLEAGVIKDGEKVELIRGELVEMSPQGPLHSDMTHLLLRWLRWNLPRDLDFASQGPFRLSEEDEPEPEFFVFPDGLGVNDVRGSDVLLVIEVAFSSLRIDLNVKSVVYAEHGVREYWVVDLEGKRTLVHTLGADGGYGAPREVAFDQALDAPGGARLVIADLAPKA
jgi:Uma2 family endonuclease